MKNEEREKLRGLFVVRADKAFDQSHPLWETIRSYKTILEETHVLIFTKARVRKGTALTEPEPGLYFYQCSTRYLLLRAWRTWKLLAFQMYWQTSFRADFVVSFTSRKGGLFAYFLAKRFKRAYFLVSSQQPALGSAWSLRHKIARYLLRHATAVFVPGSQTALSLSRLLTIPPAKLVALQPVLDMATIARSREKFDFHRAHPQYNFFVSAYAVDREELRALIMVYARVAVRYPRMGLIVIAPAEVHQQLHRFVRRSRSYGVFVYPQGDTYLALLSGTQAYLGVNRTEETDIMLVSALGLGVPVVAYKFGLVAEILGGTRYERFASETGDTEGMAARLLELIEHQPTRDDYAVNTDIVYKKFPVRDIGEYVRRMHDVVSSIVAPLKEGTSAGVMYLHNLQLEEAERLTPTSDNRSRGADRIVG